jgi:hypothetical protein
MSSDEQNVECPICYDEIDVLKNCVTTECGHKFHCSCLMKNSATNGFSCPMCRSVMAEEPELSDSDDDEEESLEDDLDEIEDNALTSFRMFHQQLAGEEVEEEPLIEEDNLSQSLSQSLDQNEEPIVKPTAALIATKLIAQGYTMEDLVKCLLIEHEEYEADSDENDRCSDRMFGKFRQIISNYPREQEELAASVAQEAHISSRLRSRDEVEDCFAELKNRYLALEASDDEDV